MKNKIIFLDKASTSKPYKQIWKYLIKIQNQIIGNPSSIHFVGQKTKSLIEQSRRDIAAILNIPVTDIIFTSSATESNNTVIFNKKYDFFVTLNTVHSSIFNTLVNNFNKQQIIFIKQYQGKIDFNHLNFWIKKLKQNKVLFIFEHVNSDTGIIYNIFKISSMIKQYNNNFEILIDETQAVGKLKVLSNVYNIDYFSFVGHKIRSFKGIGILVIKNLHTRVFKPLIHGGKQEFKKRAGTENVIGILSLAFAFKKKMFEFSKNNNKMKILENCFLKELAKRKKLILNSNIIDNNKIMGIFNFNYQNYTHYRNDLLCYELSEKNINISSGSACSSGSIETWRVMKNMFPDIKPECNLRVSFNEENTQQEIIYFFKQLDNIFKKHKIII